MAKRRQSAMVLIAMLIFGSSILPCDITWAADERRKERMLMVNEQISSRGIRDVATLQAMRQVQRHLFVPASQSRYAYADRALPIGYGQTISQPFMVAYMTEIVSPGPGKRILEIGTGSGYQAAILAATGAMVYSVEIIPELADSARKRLGNVGFRKVRIKSADGYHGWKKHAPYDAIIVTAAAEFIPPPLVGQLVDGGLMVIPVGSPFMVQSLVLVQKRQGQTITANLMPVRFVPFRRAE